jgi:hypothetical protein
LYALNQVENEGLVEGLELYELRTLSVTRQTEILENSKRITGGGAVRWCRRAGRVVD